MLVCDPSGWAAGMPGGHGNPCEVHFWFFNIQANVKQRLAAWRAKKKGN